MNEVTPDQIKQIASRLFHHAQQAAVKPDVGTPTSFAPPISFSPPSPPISPPTSLPTTMPSSIAPHQLATTAPNAGGLSRLLPIEVPTVGNVPTPGAPSSHSPFPSHTSSGEQRFPHHPAIAQNGPSDGGQRVSGLREFVRGVQFPDQSSSFSAVTSNDHNVDQGLLQRLLKRSVVNNGGSQPLDIPSIRNDFPALHQNVHGVPLVWFDNAATTQKPQCVIDAVSQYYARDNSNIHRAAHTLAGRSTDAFEGARSKVQKFLGASSNEEIVFVRGTTEGINLVAQTYGRKFLQPGDEILLSHLEHHANIVPWQMIAKEKGAHIRVIPVNDRGEIQLEQYQSLLGPRTKILALTQASNSLGTIPPVAEMIQMAKRYNARVLIDGAQSVAHIPVNVQQLDADFFVFSGHKIFGPTGIGAVYIKQELHEILPPWQGGGNMIRNVTFEETTYNPAPAKFEAGTPNIADTVGLGAALDYVNRLGLSNIAKYEHHLLEYATEKLSRIPGLRLIGTAREKVSVLSFVLKNHRTEEVGKLLDLEGIAVRSGHHCSQPSLRRFGVETTVRPSLAFYNTVEEIDRLVAAIERIQRLNTLSR